MCDEFELKLRLRDWARFVPVRQMLEGALPRGGLCRPGDAVMMLSAAGAATQAGMARWGLVGHFLDVEPRQPMTTLGSEGLASRPFYSRLLAGKRCVVPCTAFSTTRSFGRRESHTLRHFPKRPGLLLLAAVYDRHPRAGLTCAILTEAVADAAVAERRPVVLGEADMAAWLAVGEAPAEAFAAVLEARQRVPWRVEPLETPRALPQLSFDFA